MLGSRTQGGRMEGADESTELWRHPLSQFYVNEIILGSGFGGDIETKFHIIVQFTDCLHCF